jgi:hypothetical protein
MGLLASCKLLDKEHGQEITTKSFGDKETFWLGLAAMGSRIGWADDYRTGVIGVSELVSVGKWKVCSVQVLHVDEFGHPAWLNGGLSKNKYFNENSLAELKEYSLQTDNTDVNSKWVSSGKEVWCYVSTEEPSVLSEVVRSNVRKSGELYLQAVNFLNK